MLEPAQTFRNKGAVAEAFVGQDLLACASATSEPQLYYWYSQSRNGSAEIDYVIVEDSKVMPIEVKSNKASQLKSMHLFLESHQYSSYGVRVSTLHFSQFDNIHSYPLYAVAKLLRQKQYVLDFIAL